MTTETRLLQAAAVLRSVLADLERLAADHPDRSARRVFSQQVRPVQGMLRRLDDRLAEVRRQEPEYAVELSRTGAGASRPDEEASR